MAERIAAGQIALELDGAHAGYVRASEGGDMVADVIVEAVGTASTRTKHLGAARPTDIVLTCGLDMSKAFFDWLGDTLDGSVVRKNGTIVFSDFDGSEVSRLAFSDALITEIGFPAFDAAAKDAVYLTVKLSPEATTRVKGSGAKAAGKGLTKSTHKQWSANAFRVSITGLETACSRISKVGALTVRIPVAENPVGEFRVLLREPTHLEIPDLVVTLAASHADQFSTWHHDFVINGNSGTGNEKSGYFEALSVNLKDVLFRIDFFALGIYKLAAERVVGSKETITRVTAAMYCERLAFAPSATTTSTTTSGAASKSESKSAPPSRAEEQQIDVRSGLPVLVQSGLATDEVVLGRHIRRDG
jgi:hypothetical protein